MHDLWYLLSRLPAHRPAQTKTMRTFLLTIALAFCANIRPTQAWSATYVYSGGKVCGDCDAGQGSGTGSSTWPDYGPSGERWQTAVRTDVSACEATCTANVQCGGFVWLSDKCYFRDNDTTCGRSDNTLRDCYSKIRPGERPDLA